MSENREETTQKKGNSQTTIGSIAVTILLVAAIWYFQIGTESLPGTGNSPEQNLAQATVAGGLLTAEAPATEVPDAGESAEESSEEDAGESSTESSDIEEGAAAEEPEPEEPEQGELETTEVSNTDATGSDSDSQESQQSEQNDAGSDTSEVETSEQASNENALGGNSNESETSDGEAGDGEAGDAEAGDAQSDDAEDSELEVTATPEPLPTDTPTPEPTAASTATPSPEPTPTPTITPLAGPPGMRTIRMDELPPEAIDTINLIWQNGPFPFDKDDTTFGNREERLPDEEYDYYREFTVITPGLSHRGARRIVEGAEGELYYTDDHYDSFYWVITE